MPRDIFSWCKAAGEEVEQKQWWKELRIMEKKKKNRKVRTSCRSETGVKSNRIEYNVKAGCSGERWIILVVM